MSNIPNSIQNLKQNSPLSPDDESTISFETITIQHDANHKPKPKSSFVNISAEIIQEAIQGPSLLSKDVQSSRRQPSQSLLRFIFCCCYNDEIEHHRNDLIKIYFTILAMTCFIALAILMIILPKH